MKMSELNITQMTRKEFAALPHREWAEDIGTFTGFVIMPTGRMHDSGWAAMHLIAHIRNKPICILTSCTDDIELENLTDRSFRIDMLYKSKLVNVWSNEEMTTSSALSSITITKQEVE